jgi:hypothetical protein
MKAAVHTLFAIWIISLAVIAQPVFGDVAREQALCVTDKEIAQSIQFVRITTRDDLDTYTANVVKWSKPGEPMGHAQTPDQITIKDHFWQRNLAMAVMVYELPIGWSPEYVGNYMLKMCQWKFEIRRWQDEKTQKYEL